MDAIHRNNRSMGNYNNCKMTLNNSTQITNIKSNDNPIVVLSAKNKTCNKSHCVY
jgi:hypothetical protein